MSFDSSCQDPIIESKPSHHAGLTVITAAVFIAGEMAGTGLLALPSAMNQAGWTGLFSTFLLCFLSGYSGIKLGECWTMLRIRNPVFCEEGSRSPFQVIATEGAGKIGKYVLIFVIYFQLMGATVIQRYLNRRPGVVFLLLAAQNLNSLFSAIHAELPVCIWVIIVAVVLLGPCWLGTPKDNWFIAIGAMSCTAIAAVFITISALIHLSHDGRKDEPSEVTFKSFSFSFGTMLFAWGGSAMFPTIQVDMRDPHKFHYSVVFAYIILLVFYLPVSIVGYVVYGGSAKDSILENLPKDFFRYAVEILITGHLGLAFTIVLNPIFQGFEDAIRIPHHFSWKRAVVRSCIVLFLALLALTIPHFGAILSFIGSSTVSVLGFILPVICFVMIKVQMNPLVGERFIDTVLRVIPPWEIFCLLAALAVGAYGAIASSYSSFSQLVSPDSFVEPCWLNIHSVDPATNGTST